MARRGMSPRVRSIEREVNCIVDNEPDPRMAIVLYCEDVKEMIWLELVRS